MNTPSSSVPNPPRASLPPGTPQGTETILVVDDEPLVLKISVHELRKLGYHVIPAHSGEEALDCLSRQAVDLLVMDLLMPGLDGLQCFQRIRSLRPGLKTIVYTGYAPPATVAEVEAMGAGPFLLKPTSLPVLARAIRSRLDNP